MIFNIDNEIEFSPELNRLKSLQSPGLTVNLPTPASQCLVLLLQKAPDVVSHEEFMDAIWRKEGMLVPVNTLYQNISILRKNLRKVSASDKKIILTKSRQGFAVCGVTVTVVDEQRKDVVINTVRPSPELLNKPERDILPGICCNSFRRKITFASFNFKRSALLLLIFSVLMISLFLVINTRSSEEDFYVDHSLSLVKNGCHFRYSPKDDAQYIRDVTEQVKAYVDCNKYPYAYIPLNNYAPAFTILACREPYENSDNSCVSHYFYRG